MIFGTTYQNDERIGSLYLLPRGALACGVYLADAGDVPLDVYFRRLAAGRRSLPAPGGRMLAG
jgi:hypothetical protein